VHLPLGLQVLHLFRLQVIIPLMDSMEVVTEDTERRTLEARGVGIILVRNLIFNVSIVGRMDMRQKGIKNPMGEDQREARSERRQR